MKVNLYVVPVCPVPFSSLTKTTEQDAAPAVSVVTDDKAADGWFAVPVHGEPVHVPSFAYSIAVRAAAELPDAVKKTKLLNGFILTGRVTEVTTIEIVASAVKMPAEVGT